MSAKVKVLQLGETDLSGQYEISTEADWYYEPDLSETEISMFEVVILGRCIRSQEREQLFWLTKAWCLFVTDTFEPDEDTQWLMRSKCGQVLDADRLSIFLKEEIPDYYGIPYGEKYSPGNIAITDGIRGEVEWDGFMGPVITADFGKEFRQVAYWRNNIPVFQNQSIDFWLEYEKSGTVEIQLKITQFKAGSVSTVQNNWEFSAEELRDVVYITNRKKEGPIFVSLMAKGEGQLKIIALHDRYSRRGKGAFLPGGRRLVTPKREEIFFYFDPGDRKPPLNVYFSGYKTLEGFEGYNMMRRMGAPFLLVSEARLEGGAFYIGSAEYEQMMIGGIQSYLDELQFTPEQMIFSGLSMGTFGALYYGCDFKPFAIFAGKPLASIGDVADNERIHRPGGFPTSLDVLLKHYGSLDAYAVEKANLCFWNKFDATEWEDTRFVIAYMIEDDYDPTAYPTLLSHIRDDCIEVYSKGLHGRHNDNTAGIVSWFVNQYNNVLHTYFTREFGED